MKKFDEKYENNNIITLGQKIDYFTYLFKKDSSINPNIIEIKNNKISNNNSNSYYIKKTKKNKLYIFIQK